MRSLRSLSAEMLLAMVIAAALLHHRVSSEPPCPAAFAEELRDAERLDAGGGFRSATTDIAYGDGDVFVANGTLFGCVCRATACLRKCCPLGQHVFNKSCDESELDFFENGYVRANGSERVVEGFLECSPGKDRYLLQPFVYESEGFRVEDGVLIWENLSLAFGYEDYCVDVFDDGVVNDTRALVCLEEYKELIDYYLGKKMKTFRFTNDLMMFRGRSGGCSLGFLMMAQ